MRIGSMRALFGATVVIAACLLGVTIGRPAYAGRLASAGPSGRDATRLRQAAAAQNAPERVPMTEEVFKTVVLLRGIPVDTFFEAMGLFASSMGEDCTFCHASKAYFDKAAFAEQTPRIQRARQMITMMNAINKQYFGGRPRVTCFTCHGGSRSPVSDPNIALQYATPTEDPNVRELPPDISRTSADQVFDKYFQAIGGADRVAKLTSFTAKGTYAGFDTAFDKIAVELYARAPAQQTMVVHFFNGNSTRTFDGRSGWMAGPDTPLPLVTLTGGNLERARIEAMVAFPAGIRQAYPKWQVARSAINDREVMVLQGIDSEGQKLTNLYFDDTGLLVRMTRWTQTPVGFVPTVVDYADYRDVGGVKVPFKRTVSQTYMQMIVELSDVQPNVQIPAARFERPAPVTRPGA